MYLLAQVMSEKEKSGVFFWGTILILAVIIGGGLIMFIRRKYFRDTTESGEAAGFSLSELRAMRDRGEITPEEYETTRARVIAKVKAKANEPRNKKPDPLLPPDSDISPDSSSDSADSPSDQ